MLKTRPYRLKKHLAFVLGGGGARGALQVGALRALLEANIKPDLLVGTSVGAVNATYLAVHGVNLRTIESLVEAWHDAAMADLLPSNYLWLTVRALFKRTGGQALTRLRDFYIAHGLAPDLRFSDIQGVRLIIVAADLNTGRAVLYGSDPRQSVLEGLLCSTGLPPWVYPLEKDGRLLMDGGVVSNLPIEPALAQGATEMIALGLADPRRPLVETQGFGSFISKLLYTAEQRQMDVELALAEARGIPVHHIALRGHTPVALWDFSHTDELIARGYELTRQAVAQWSPQGRATWRKWLAAFWPKALTP